MESDRAQPGQFDDAPESNALAQAPDFDPREGGSFIDHELLEWSEPSDDEDEEVDEELEDYENIQVDDEDWEVAERDFTKQYNRLRQHVAVRTGTQSTSNGQSVVPLPAINRPSHASGSQSQSTPTPTAKSQKTSSQLEALSKYSSRLTDISTPYSLGVSVNRKGPSQSANQKDKSDRATNEQVLDPRTRIILYKMIGRELISQVNGCVSTGKEANVYHALTPTNQHLALKIYKTSILIFKDRDRYVTGEHRFRRGYSKKNPRKMVRLWAEKEMRNLRRLQATGINCPEPIEVRENVLVMGFLGDSEGWASPRLKDADIPSSTYELLYISLLQIVRSLYHQCKLVHADLSEYNILYHNSSLYIIDVSQSVEHDHPNAFNFLRSDLKNVEEFFERKPVRCVGLRRAFEFVTGEPTEEESAESNEALIRKWMDEPAPAESSTDADGDSHMDTEPQKDKTQEDSVFLNSYIPRTLNEVYDPERDVNKLKAGKGEELIYKGTIGIVTAPVDVKNPADPKEPKAVRFAGEEDSKDGSEEENGEDESDDDTEESDAEGEKFEKSTPRGHRHEDKDAKKVRFFPFPVHRSDELGAQERKKAVKEEAREKRKQKMPKVEKKKKIKNSRGRG
ncbi:RIO1-domain-containing protein [Sistotremastrum niveocremeum HHB9708]|uniref:Serine/threonine-protein kinase RIO1 n=1 Tax=Sistotremastrum niveocremeum HHB9708 TaxID=1314777 RepID=A0A164WT11_9AGAM|nr:RIO1-domain-containing protein [Sistotremastrum niveocremeum HHB9708]